jgi:hypothetical protein
VPRIAVSLSSAIVAVVGLLLNVVAQETYDEPHVIDEASQAPGQPGMRPANFADNANHGIGGGVLHGADCELISSVRFPIARQLNTNVHEPTAEWDRLATRPISIYLYKHCL